ncbi:MAG: ATPase AAA, partial [Candidatus Magnetoglobus multicellularis str. Araruama]
KTQLAYSVAHELELKMFEFHTQTTSTAKDLFYVYDTLSHFQDAHGTAALIKDKYVFYNAFGKAILLACDEKEVGQFSNNEQPFIPDELSQKPARSVVLIDEIDKAPRDLPNDILNDILTMSFTVTETQKTFKADNQFRPIIILTSNSEKNLPEAFFAAMFFLSYCFSG